MTTKIQLLETIKNLEAKIAQQSELLEKKDNVLKELMKVQKSGLPYCEHGSTLGNKHCDCLEHMIMEMMETK